MTVVRYEAQGHRLRIAGACRTTDRVAIQEALDTFARVASGHVIVDLTAVTIIDQGAANAIVTGARRSRRAGGTVVFVRKHGTPVDDALTTAERAGVQRPSRPTSCPDRTCGPAGRPPTWRA